MKITDLEKKYDFKTSDFENAVKNYYKAINVQDKSDFIAGETERTFDELCEKLEDILHIAATEGKVKEEADLYWSSKEHIIPKASIETVETQMVITIGLFRDFYITTKLKYPNHLKSMKDDFWRILGSLQDFGKFEFKEENGPTPELKKKYSNLFNQRGGIFKIMRNYFINQIEYGQCSSIGYISVRWDNRLSFDETLLNYIQTFKIMYNLNYLLWLEEIKTKRI